MAANQSTQIIGPQDVYELRRLLAGEGKRMAMDTNHVYPQIELSGDEDGKVIMCERRGRHRGDLSAKVAETLRILNAAIRANAAVQLPVLKIGKTLKQALNNGKYCVQKFYEDLPNLSDEGVQAVICILPLLSMVTSTPVYMKSLILAATDSVCLVDVTDYEQGQFFIKYILENPAILKLTLSAKVDVPLLWNFFGGAPDNLFCLSSAAKRMVDMCGILFEEEKDAESGFPWMRFFGKSLRKIVVKSESGVMDISIVEVAHEFLLFCGFILKCTGILLENSNADWPTIFTWNPVPLVKQYQKFLTKDLGLNFWSAYMMALNQGKDMRVFVYAFLYTNFCTLPEIGIPGEVEFQEVVPVYRTFQDVMQKPEECALGLKLDKPFMSTTECAQLLCNDWNGNALVPLRTQVGTLGELKRRVYTLLKYH